LKHSFQRIQRWWHDGRDLKNNTTADAVAVMPEVIQEVVRNALENVEGLDLDTEEGLEHTVWQIIDHYDIVTQGEIKMNFDEVYRELQALL